MSDYAASAAWPGRAAEGAWAGPDARRRLQLALAATWLLDAVLQRQSFIGIFSGSATDPDSGPMLVLLALLYWPAATRSRIVTTGPAR